MGGIFITYRRDDASGYVHAIRDRLVTQFGSGQVFMDIDSIEPGLDFVEVIENSVASCSVVLLLIGKRWQPGRLQDNRDFVRLELRAALERKIRVIPVLLEGAQMPSAEELSPDLALLSRRQAFEISNRHFTDDLNELIVLLGRIVAEQEAQKTNVLPQVESNQPVSHPPPTSRSSAPGPEPPSKRAAQLDRLTKFTWIVLSLPASLGTIFVSVFTFVALTSSLSAGDLKLFPIFISIGISCILFWAAMIARYRRSAGTSTLLVVNAALQFPILLAIFGISPPTSGDDGFGLTVFSLGVASGLLFLAYRYKKLAKPPSSIGAPSPPTADSR